MKEPQRDLLAPAMGEFSATTLDGVRPANVGLHQRNRVLGWTQLHPLVDDLSAYMVEMKRAGILGFDQLRTLICDGPKLLAWVGACQEAKFTEEQTRSLRKLVPILRKRFQLEDRMMIDGTLRLVLDSIDDPAFLFKNGTLRECNVRGQVLLEEQGSAFRLQLRDWSVAENLPDTVHRTEAKLRGGGRSVLLILRDAPRDNISAKVRVFAEQVSLTKRQTEVLALVANGEANKTIAVRLELSVRAVEQHLSGIFERAGVESRTELVARVLK